MGQQLFQSSLSYTGVRAPTPPNIHFYNRAPLTTDSQQYVIGDMWIVKNPALVTNQNVYMLVALLGGVATWVLFVGGHGNLVSLTGNTGGTVFGDANENINVVGDAVNITVTGNPGTNTLTISPVNGSLATRFQGDVGAAAVPAAGLILINSAASAGNPVNNMNTSSPGAGNQVFVALDNSIFQPNTNALGSTGQYALGGDSFLHNYGTRNTFVGAQAGGQPAYSLTGTDLSGVGYHALTATTSGSRNAASGSAALAALTSASDCSGFGYHAGTAINTGAQNTFVGSTTGGAVTSGALNVALGYNSGSAWATGTEFNNIMVGNIGVNGETRTMRYGTAVTHTRAFMAAVTGIATGNTNPKPVVVDSAGQLGTGDSSGAFYTTGTFIPTLAFGGASVGITYLAQAASYTQIGRMVWFLIHVELTSKGVSVGNASINGIPGGSVAPGFPSNFSVTQQYITGTAGYTTLSANNNVSLNIFDIVEENLSGGAALPLTDAAFANNSVINMYGWYYTAFYPG